jgi:DNA-binding transcriptional LysR family regulator
MVKSWAFPVEGGAPIEIAPPNRLRLDDLAAITDAVVDGFGLAWLPCWLIRDRVRAGKLVPLLLDSPRMIFETHALWPEAPHLPLRVRLAIDALAAALPGHAEL